VFRAGSLAHGGAGGVSLPCHVPHINFHFIAHSKRRCRNALMCSFVFLLARRAGVPGITLPGTSLPLAMRSGMTRSGVPRVSKQLTQFSIASMSLISSSTR
jgi:hypothetical protein